MLVLSRKVGEQIRIGQSIVVTLLHLDRQKARLGVEAPADVPIFRQELLDFDRARSASSRLNHSPGASSAGQSPGARPSGPQIRANHTPIGSSTPSSASPGRLRMARTLWDSVSA